MRIGLVLSAGGLRGAAHLGVMRKLLAHDIPIDVIVGASAGAVVAAYYAAVGLTVDELIDDARGFKGRHLVAHSLAQSRPASGDRQSRPASMVTAHVACAGLEWGHPAAVGPASSRPIRPAASRGQLSRGRVSRSDTSSATLPVYGFRWRRAAL